MVSGSNASLPWIGGITFVSLKRKRFLDGIAAWTTVRESSMYLGADLRFLLL
jgi:hypothetical protein